jgi:predicted HicB family RNase H-like nuclease
MRKEKPKKVGRPSLGKDARSVVLQSRVQQSEKAAYQKAAKSQGKDLSTWVRENLNLALGK